MDIDITDVQLVERSEGTGRQSRKGVVDVSVSVRNNSVDVTYHLVACVRWVSFEESTKTIEIGFCASEKSIDSKFGWFTLPKARTLLPGKACVLTAHIPVILIQWRTLKEGGLKARGLDFKRFDIRDGRRVRCTIAYDRTAFRPVVGVPSSDIYARFRAWGKRITREFERSVEEILI